MNIFTLRRKWKEIPQ